VQALVAGGHFGALGTDPRLRRSDLIRSGGGRGPLLGLPGLEDADLVVQRGREQAPRLFAQPLDAPLPVLLLLFEVVDARALDLRRLRRLGCLVLETVPLGCHRCRACSASMRRSPTRPSWARSSSRRGPSAADPR